VGVGGGGEDRAAGSRTRSIVSALDKVL